jgi:N-acetylglutamate synthase-like GNAT family acetyltransferase
MITAAVEPWRPTLDEMLPLLPLHWEELALDKDKVPLMPQWLVYDERDAKGELQIVVLREDGRIIGYYWGLISPGLHYASCLTANMDIFFVHPEHRKGRNGIILFQAVERDLRRRGVQRWFVGTKLHRDCSALFRRLGFEPIEIHHSKWLGD